jgi:hypothetical protein
MAETNVRERLTSMRDGLLALHRRLLDSERAAYERDVARITTTGQYLGLVLNDPWFAWLRELSQFIVVVDERLAAKNKDSVGNEEGEALMARARQLIAPAEDGAGFARSYWAAMQRDPGVVLAHGEMLRVFNGLARR